MSVTFRQSNKNRFGWLWPGLLLGAASLVCAGLFWRLGAVGGLAATLGLLALAAYAALSWWRPHLALGLLLFLPLAAESQERTNYDLLAQFEFALHSSFSTTLNGPPFTPLEVLMIVLAAVAIVKRFTIYDLRFTIKNGAATDSTSALQHSGTSALPKTQNSKLKIQNLLLFLFGLTLLWGYGWGVVVQKGDAIKGLWEVRAFAYMLLLYWLTSYFVTNERQWRTVFKFGLLAIGLLAVKVVLRFVFFIGTFSNINDQSFDHENALLYNVFLLFGLSWWLFRPKPRFGGRIWWTVYLSLLPFVGLAMFLQQRRAGFASLAVALVMVVVLGFWQRPRLFSVLVPLAVIAGGLYLAAFWESQGTLAGQPARAIRSIFEPNPRDYLSNIYRENEFYNLMETGKTSPVLGIGFGQQFTFYKPLSNLDYWPFWRYTPHNELLWVWLKTGAVGFGLFVLLFAYVIGRGARQFWRQRGTLWQPLLLVAVCAVVMQLLHSWLDQGFSRPRNLIWLGIVLALIAFVPTKSTRTEQP